MKTVFLALGSLIVAQSAFSMPCDTSWSCKSKSGKYVVDVQRCRYSNALGVQQSVKINGQEISDAKLGASYDSQSIGGKILAFEISLPDTKNDARYLSVEMVGGKGTVTERVQPFNPGPQKAVASEAISCQIVD
jgi:hypothetical protein